MSQNVYDVKKFYKSHITYMLYRTSNQITGKNPSSQNQMKKAHNVNILSFVVVFYYIHFQFIITDLSLPVKTKT